MWQLVEAGSPFARGILFQEGVGGEGVWLLPAEVDCKGYPVVPEWLHARMNGMKEGGCNQAGLG